MNGLIRTALMILIGVLFVLLMFYIIYRILAKMFNIFTKLFYLIHDIAFSYLLISVGLNLLSLVGIENNYINVFFVISGFAIFIFVSKTKGAYPYDKGYIFACIIRGIYVLVDGIGIGYLITRFLIPEKTILWTIVSYVGAFIVAFILSQNMVNIKRFEDIE